MSSKERLTPTEELLTTEVVHDTEALANSHLVKHFIIDLQEIRYLVSGSLYPDAEPLTPMLKMHRQWKEGGRQLVLCNLTREIAEVFRVTRLDQIFDIQPDVDATLSSLSDELK